MADKLSVTVLEGRAVLEGFLSAFKQGDVSGALAFVHEDFLATYPASLPMGGEWRGHKGMLELFGQIGAMWVGISSKVDRYICEGDHVVALCTTSGKVGVTRTTDVVMPIAEIYRIEDGKIREARPYFWDKASLVAALSRT